MSERGKFLTLNYQIFAWLGFMVLFGGLLFQFFSESEPSFTPANYIFILIDCSGAIIVVLSIFFAFYSHRNNQKELWQQITIESSLTFAFNFSIQAVVFHYFFHNISLPANLGIFFAFIAYMFAFVSLVQSLLNTLLWKYKWTVLPAICFVAVSTLISGVFLTFTGSNEQITGEGISALSLGIISILAIIITFIFYPKWKFLLSKDEKKEVEEEERNEDNDEIE